MLVTLWSRRQWLVSLVLMACLAGSAQAQMLYVAGGAAPEAGAQVGSRVWLSDLFQIQGGLTMQDRLSAEATLLFRPFARGGTIEPYAFFGVGGYLDQGIEQRVVPIGIGAEYHLNDQLGIFVEVAGRWNLAEETTAYRDELDFSVLPSFGVSWQMNLLQMPSFGGGLIAEAEPEAEEAPVEAVTEAQPEAQPETPATARPQAISGAVPNESLEAEATPQRTVLQPVTISGIVPGAATDADTDALVSAKTPARAATPEPGLQLATAVPQLGVLVNLLLPDTVEIDTADYMVLVPDGTFILGLTDEDPLQLQTAGLRRVTLSSFYMDQHEVSNREYRAFLEILSPQQRASMLPDTTMGQAGGNRFSWSEYLRGDAFADYPVVGVTHSQAEAYCASVGKRLPTEAEWEYAARGGQLGGVYPWAGLEPRNEQGKYLANYNPGRGGYAADGFAFTAPVESFPASRWQLYNVSGNVAEWVQDAYHPSYASLSDFNPLYSDPDEDRRIVRGGSWASDAFYIGVGVRDSHPANEASPYIGFRCVRDL